MKVNCGGACARRLLCVIRRLAQAPLQFLRSSLICFALIFVSRVCAQGPAPTPLASPAGSPPTAVEPTETSVAPHELSRADLEAFLDALVPSQLENRNIAGAVVAAVKDGQVFLTKGYGYADYEKKKPVSPSQTLFRPGSISKLFTATAVMQLVEQDKLDLDRDVNEYLDFAIRKTFVEPITLRRLLTHTAGFEETLKNLFVPNEKSMRPLRDYLLGATPARIFPAGKIPSYSNYGLSVAGYIVERVSGEKFEDYVSNHIMRPLQMAHSTFAQPLPPSLAPLMSNGYIEATGKPQPFEFVQAAPAGSLSATADDMCRFMLAFLNKGTLEGATILQPGTVQEMQARQFAVHPALNSLGLVFMEYSMNGFKAWGHGGDTIYFHSDLWLVPDANFGFFISYNSAAPRPGGGRGEILRALFDRYFAKAKNDEVKIDQATAKADAGAVSGVYETTRRAETSLLRLSVPLGQSAVRANADGTISIDTSKNLRGQLKRWREVEPLVYEEVNGSDKLAFRRKPAGRVTELLSQPPIDEGQRAPWYDNKKFVFSVVGGSLAFVALTVLLWPIAAILRRRYHRPLFPAPVGRGMFLSSRVICLLLVAWTVVLIVLFTRAGTDIALLGDGLNPWLYFLHITGWILAAGTVVLFVIAARFWKMQTLGIWPRLHATLIAVSCAIFICYAWHCHLLDASLKF